MADLNVGIVGLGWVAGAHIETFQNVQGASVAAICSRRRLDENELQQRYGTPFRTYRRLEEMLADESIDILDICTPHSLHPQQAIAGARAGKHLIIEKPVALNLEDASAMRQAIAESGVSTCVCFEVRFSEMAETTLSLLDQG